MTISNGVFTILNQAGLLLDEEINLICQIISNANEKLSIISAINKIKPELSSDKVLSALSDFYGIPILNIEDFDLKSMPKNLFDVDFMIANKILPLAIRDKRLKLAVIDPTNKDLFKSIAFKTGLPVDLVLIEEAKFLSVVKQNSRDYFKTIKLDEIDLITDEPQFPLTISSHDMVNSDEGDEPIVKFIHKIIFDAVQLGASDIHFEPYETDYRVRYRVDGELFEVASPPSAFKDKVAARIKVVSKLDIAEKRIPQDGRLRLSLPDNQMIDFRVSTLPTSFGEKIVLRVLDRKSASLGIGALGLESDQRAIILDTIKRPYGMVLVTGPTGSGKTITLYTCLSILNNASRNISTIEDPIEIPLAGINQVSINEKTGLDFTLALRAFLRQDPDVIMVGEIRDLDTAEMAIKAAQTGHLVLSTLHTNNAPSALTRLVSMGVPVYKAGDAILLIIAQRLVRKLCTKCKVLAKFDKETLLKAGFKLDDINNGWQPYINIGCEACHNTGYKGRVGIFEVMQISDELKRLILLNATSTELACQARKEGILSLRESGLLKVRSGITSLSEVEANTNE